MSPKKKSADKKEEGFDELEEIREQLKKEMFNLRFNNASAQLEKSAKTRSNKIGFARVEAIIDARRRDRYAKIQEASKIAISKNS